MVIIGGAGLLLLVAAFVEAYWSPRAGVPVGVKYVVGVMLWGVVILYLVLAGRGHRGS